MRTTRGGSAIACLGAWRLSIKETGYRTVVSSHHRSPGLWLIRYGTLTSRSRNSFDTPFDHPHVVNIVAIAMLKTLWLVCRLPYDRHLASANWAAESVRLSAPIADFFCPAGLALIKIYKTSISEFPSWCDPRTRHME